MKKEGRNQGRWFYTCQMAQDKRCDFFLWDEDAKLRTEAAVMSNSRTEPQPDADVQEGWNAGRTLQGKGLFAAPKQKGPAVKEDSPTPTPSPTPPSVNSSRKRNARDADLDDEVQPWSLTGDEEDELLEVASSAEAVTPQKAQKTGVYATPATSAKKSSRTLPWLQEPPTPVSSSKKPIVDYFNTPSKTPSKKVTFAEDPITEPETPKPIEDLTAPTTLAAPSSPSPSSRYKDALVNPADSQASLTNEVLSELSNVKLPPEKLSSLRSILTKHDLRTQGVTKGRDISRLALKAKEAKIAELEAKIASLEAEREVDRGVIARLRWKRESGVEDEEMEESQL